MNPPRKQSYEFGPFRLDATERQLLRAGETVALTPKAFDLLLVLVEQRGRLREKDELLKLVWPDTIVEEANLSYNISLIRKALGEGENGQRYIETVPRRGYRFVASVGKAQPESEQVTELALPTDSSERAAAQADAKTGSLIRQRARHKQKVALVLSAMLVVLGVAGAGLYRFFNRSQAPSRDSGTEPKIVPVTSFASAAQMLGSHTCRAWCSNVLGFDLALLSRKPHR